MFAGQGYTQLTEQLPPNPPQYMAVSIQGPLYTIPNMWSMGEPPDTFPTTASEGQPLAPAYQYPLPSNSIIPTYTDLPPHSEASGPNQDPSTSRNKGGPLMVKTAKIKRSISTPNVRGQASADAAAMAISAEKRRNKLGYHRTSVACGKKNDTGCQSRTRLTSVLSRPLSS